MFAFCQDMPGVQEETVRRIEDEIGAEQPEGCVAHVSGPCEGGWRIIDVWEDEAAMRRFHQERLFPAITRVTGSAPSPDAVEIRKVESVFARVGA